MSMQQNRYKAEMEWGDLWRKPAKLFGYSYFYFILIIVALGYYYITNLTEIGKNSVEPSVLSDSSAFIQDIPLQSARIIPPVDVMKIRVPTSELISKGGELFKANCSSCHGDNGEGNGPTATTLTPKPRNFHMLDGWKNGSKIVEIYKTLEEGIPGGGMASYNYLPPQDRFSLIHYLRSLAQGQPIDSDEELKKLDATYQLSLGMNVAGQIPVKKAIRLMDAEAKKNLKTISDQLKTALSAEGRGADIFWKSVRNPAKLFASLRNNPKASLEFGHFIKTVSADPVQAGFKPSVARLSDSEWRDMHGYLLNVVEWKDK